MIYRALGLMSGSSLDGLDLLLAELHESGGQWTYQVLASACYPYTDKWAEMLRDAQHLKAADYLRLHSAYGHYLGEQVNRFIEEHQLEYQVQLIASHGHTVFHAPASGMTAQLGDGAAIAAVTGINVVSDLRAVDIALGGQGAPIVPIGEKLLFGNYGSFLNLGGIANLSLNLPGQYIAFDVCPANRVLNLLAAERGLPFDEGGKLASAGTVSESMLALLNGLDYYAMPYPKSLSNDFGTDVVYPLLRQSGLSLEDRLRTYVEHIAVQVSAAYRSLPVAQDSSNKMLITGGGAHHTLLLQRLAARLLEAGVEAVVPDSLLVDFKEALVMALFGVLRWREETNTLASVTGASRNSVGGAVWLGQEA